MPKALDFVGLLTMFNGYNDSALISYELNAEREKKSDNVSKFPYQHDGGVQSTPAHPNNRQSEFWSGKPNFVGIPSVVNCNCAGCYPATENQSYQVQSTRHRPWLPKTFSVPLNGSNECKLPAYQWDNALNQICYSDPNVPYGQENGGKHSYYRQFQTENQPSVIISANKQKNGMGFQNGVRQPVMCNPNYDLTKRVNGRSYYDGDKYSLGAHSLNQVPRLPVEPYTKAVPSNLNQNRVPSTGHRKENSPQFDHFSSTKVFPENYHSGLSPVDLKNSGIHVDYSCFNRDPDFCRNNFTEIKRNNLVLQNRKDCSVTETNAEQHYGRLKPPENLKACEMFYPNLEKNQIGGYIQRFESDGMNRMPRSAPVYNDLRYAGERPQVFPYQNNPAYRNYVRPEYSQFNSQCVPGFQEINQNQCRTLPQQLQSSDQYPQGSNGSVAVAQKDNSEEAPSYGRSQTIVDGQPKPNYLEIIRSEELTKNGTSKISPLRLLRKKKLINAPQELPSAATTVETPMLDVRKFWSTWAEEEEDENVSPTQMVVLDCQNIDPEQVKLLNIYESDSSRPVNFENVGLKNPDLTKDNIENLKVSESAVDDQEKQAEISSQIEPVINNADEVIPEVDTVNVSPRKERSQEHRRKKREEIIDKWTEKKFDFLKKSEESKAAEMIRYEEEKKKIFQRRLSFHQTGINKSEKLEEDVLRFEENSQSNSPEERTISDLPTSEYRRNKFLDYSEVMVNGSKDIQKTENTKTDHSTEVFVKKEEPDIKHEAGSPGEMHDILKQIKEIELQERKPESVIVTSKKTKKLKKKKSDPLENDARTDLKVETTSKPTIKFSIQKSHDLKISFKVLNKKYEDEAQCEETKPIEDTNTELITLKYKSIQNGGKLSESKKKKGKLRRKKHAPDVKTKKSEYAAEERNPLAEDEVKTYQTDGFQVQETVDSAKIKLTFKRHKTNLETEYKIDSEDFNVSCEEHEKNSDKMENKCKKKSRKGKKHKNVATSDVGSTQLELKSMEQHSGAPSDSESIHENCLKSAKECSGKSSTFQFSYSIDEEETHKNPATPFGMVFPEDQLGEFTVQNNEKEDLKRKIDGNESLDSMAHCDGSSNRQEFLPEESADEAILSGKMERRFSEDGKSKEEIQEISLDFTRTINLPNVETNGGTEKTEDTDETEKEDKSDGEVIDSTNKIHSRIESSYELKKDLDCVEMNVYQRPTSPKERNASFESDSDKNVGVDIIERDTVGERASEVVGIEPRNIHSPESNSLVENLYDSPKEKTEFYEPDLDKSVEFENEKASKIDFENVLIKMVDPEGSEKNGVEYSEEKVVHGCERLQLSDDEHSEPSEMKLDSPLALNETLGTDTLSEYNQTDQWVEPNQVIIKEGEINCENLELSDGQSNENSSVENKFGLEGEIVDLPEFESKESATVMEDETVTSGFIGDDEDKRFLIRSELNSCTDCETEDPLNESETVKIHFNKFPHTGRTSLVDSESNDTSQGEPAILYAERGKNNDFIEEVEAENVDFGGHLANTKSDEKKELEAVNLDSANQRPEEINLDSISQNLDIDRFIHISDHMNEKSDVLSEQEMDVICHSQNPLDESRSQVLSSPSQVAEFKKDEEVNRSDMKEINEPKVALEFSTDDNQNVDVSNEVGPKEPEAQSKELPETNNFTHSSMEIVRAGTTPKNCNDRSDECITPESPRTADARYENSFVVAERFEDDKENHELIVYPKKTDEVDKQSETVFLNDELTSFMQPQDNPDLMENKNQPGSFASPADKSRINFLTGPREKEVNYTSDFGTSCSPQLNELECSSQEPPSNQESELEDGEIVDSSSDDSETKEQPASFQLRKSIEFKIQKPIRRHSIYFNATESSALDSWRPKRFTKSKSCPPRFSVQSFEIQLNIPVEDIPLPIGPPPLGSCFTHSKTIEEAKADEKTKEKSTETSVGRMLVVKDGETNQELPRGSQFGALELQNFKNASPPRSDALGAHRSKIKFTLMKRSRFSKFGLRTEKSKVFEKSESKVVKFTEDIKPKVTSVIKKLEPDVTEPTEKPRLKFNESVEGQVFTVAEVLEKSDRGNSEPETSHQKIFELTEAEVKTELSGKPEMETVETNGKSEMETIEISGKSEMETIEISGKPEMETIEISGKPEMETIEISGKPEMETKEASKIETIESNGESEMEIIEHSRKSDTETIETSGTSKIETIGSSRKPEMETIESNGKSKLEVTGHFENSEPKAVILSEIIQPEGIDTVENWDLEVVELSCNASNESENVASKIRTPDYVSETAEQASKCQIEGVPNASPGQTDEKNQKSDLEIESLCEDANVEIVDVINDFMRDEFYEDIPTSEDLPNGDSLDEKVNDDKFRNIMQNCLENAKKFLNVGNLKLFSCSVDDLLELDNQENEPATNHISRDVLLTSCEDTNDDLGLNEKFQPVDISMEFVPSDVCPEILPVDNWPYLEEEVPSSPLKSNETDLIVENSIPEDVPNRKRSAKESENYKRFRRKSLVNDGETLCTKITSHRRKTIDGFNGFLSYTNLNGVEKPNESLKCRLSLEKLTNNGAEFICPQSDLSRKTKDVQQSKKLNYKSPLWQPKVMLIRISENEVKRFKKTKIHNRSNENVNTPAGKKQKSDHASSKCLESELTLSVPTVDSVKELTTNSPDRKKHKPRFRNLHVKRKPEQDQGRPKAIETALSELFRDFEEDSKNVKFDKTKKSVTNTESQNEPRSDRHLSKSRVHKDRPDDRDRRRERNSDHYRHREKRKHDRSKHDDRKRHRSSHCDDDRKRSHLKSSGDEREVSSKDTWVCEVCGFDDADERVAHIKSHPFHCQSCHLAFQTEVHFTNHLTELHKDIRNQHHCLLCELSFHTEEEYQRHLETREHTHLEAVEKNTINTLFTLLTGAPCPVLGVVEMRPEWLPNQPGTVHFYHQATPLSLALQYLKMHRDLTHSEISKAHPN